MTKPRLPTKIFCLPPVIARPGRFARSVAALVLLVLGAGFPALPAYAAAAQPTGQPPDQSAEQTPAQSSGPGGEAAPSAGAPAPSAAQPAAPPGSGLPVPRFVSLKSDRVNLRNGPSTDYPTGWVYRRAGLPLEVIKEFEAWRQVRDAEGTTGWVLQTLLSGRRTGLVLPWEIKKGQKPPQVSIHASDSASSQVIVNVEAGVIANLHSCDGRWCRVTVENYSGYIEQKKLWGVYDGEAIR